MVNNTLKIEVQTSAQKYQQEIKGLIKKSEDLLVALTAKSKDLADKNTEMEKLSLEYKSLQKALIVTTEKLHE